MITILVELCGCGICSVPQALWGQEIIRAQPGQGFLLFFGQKPAKEDGSRIRQQPLAASIAELSMGQDDQEFVSGHGSFPLSL